MQNTKNSNVSGFERWASIALVIVFVVLWVTMVYAIMWPIQFCKKLVTSIDPFHKRLAQRSTTAEAVPMSQI